jgi:hypothetical protein
MNDDEYRTVGWLDEDETAPILQDLDTSTSTHATDIGNDDVLIQQTLHEAVLSPLSQERNQNQGVDSFTLEEDLRDQPRIEPSDQVPDEDGFEWDAFEVVRSAMSRTPVSPAARDRTLVSIPVVNDLRSGPEPSSGYIPIAVTMRRPRRSPKPKNTVDVSSPSSPNI